MGLLVEKRKRRERRLILQQWLQAQGRRGKSLVMKGK